MDKIKKPIGIRLKEHIKSEKEKTAYLDLRGKIDYVLRYYWLWILGIGGGLFLICYILSHTLFSVKDYWFYAIYVNTTAPAGNGSQLWKDFTEYAGFDTRQKKVEMNGASFFDPTIKGGTNNSYYQMYVAVTEARDLDVLVMKSEGLRAVGSSGRLLDLNDEKAASILNKYGDRLIFCVPNDEEYSMGEMEDTEAESSGELSGSARYPNGEVPVGIDISDSLLVTKYHLYDDSCALGISAYTQRPESAELFLDYILKP